MKKHKKPTKVKLSRLDNGLIRAEWDAPILMSPEDLMVLGYRKCNSFVADAQGYIVGFELHPDEYADLCARRLRFRGRDVKPTPWVKAEERVGED